MKRKSGFYFVKLDECWESLYYCLLKQVWYRAGYQRSYRDSDFQEIGELIKLPEDK